MNHQYKENLEFRKTGDTRSNPLMTIPNRYIAIFRGRAAIACLSFESRCHSRLTVYRSRCMLTLSRLKGLPMVWCSSWQNGFPDRISSSSFDRDSK
ncbi:hypothetical protein TNCV_4429021 [Trichonephila clavipes]|nr:hypothetical protein TNCV_4429021 [Trichonephila clavipes]